MSKTLKLPEARPSTRGTAVVIFKDVPPTHNWGWFAREDPRMHLQPVDKKHVHLPYKVWLERDGRRVIEPDSGIPAKVWKPLQAQIVKQREMIEAHWIGHMMEKGWLELQFVNPILILVAYPRFVHRFVRTMDLTEDFAPETLAKITPSDVVLNKEMAVLEIFPKRIEQRRHHFRLERILWT
jgi:hypothetical protein